MTIAEGEILLRKYRVERVLGQGGMGVVVAARHLELGELFAIKFLLPQAIQSAAAVERFVREARASARLKGPHVVKVHDVGRMEGGAPYMVMEHLAGTDLQGLLRTRGPLPVDEVVTYALQACEAVAEAHALGIVHRDLKPANMFLIRLPNGSPCVKVIDFGISKQVAPGEGAGQDLTQAGAVLGSPLYMSPEQIQGKAVDARSDIWALGAVLFELLTGKQPFNAPTLGELCAKLLVEAPPSPGDLRAGIPPELCRVVLKCLEKALENRFQSVAELMNELASVAVAQRSAAPPSGTAALPVPGLDALLSSTATAPAPIVVASAPPPGPAADPIHAAASPAAATPRSQTPPPADTSAGSPGTSTTDPVSHAAAPATASRRPALRVVAVALVAAAALAGTALLMRRPAATQPAPAPGPSATEAPPPPKVVKSKKWWEELPDGKVSAPAAAALSDGRAIAPAASQLPDGKATAPTAAPLPAPAAELPAPRLKWLQLRNRARALEEEHKLEEAQRALREALAISRDQLGVDDAAYPDTLQMLARIEAAVGKIEDAEKLLREAVAVLTEYGDPAEEGSDDARQALVAVLRKQGKNDEAARFWKEGDAPLPQPTASASAVATASTTAAPRRPPNPYEPWDQRKEKK